MIVSKHEDTSILEKARNLLAKEHILQEKIKAGATIGELINIDEVFKNVFAYQNRAVDQE